MWFPLCFYSTALLWMRGQSASYGSWAQGGPKPACLWGLFVNKVLLVHSPSIPWHGAYGCFRTIPAEFSSCSRDSKNHTNWAIWEARKSHKALDIHYLASYRKKKKCRPLLWMNVSRRSWLSPRMLTISLERLEAILDFLLFVPLSKMKALLWQ